ncbi:tetratricopeptide repeat protein [Pseudoalteromonas sp. N1230-9]|uniref:tetratricopeptide repeat-containing sensor histidine kinase n=1 Tax=Pseudoalteromonas sp. N1230-9 TaxID=2907156 RepID=UPI002B2BC940|nr:tetratricopeptide repeat protein [Pseudoalteromonas sp. N1230-9]
MSARIFFFISLLFFAGLNTVEAETISNAEFDKLRESIRQSYARSPIEGLERVNFLLDSQSFTLEQSIMVTNYKAWFLLEVDELEQAMKTIVEYKSMVAHSEEKSLMYGYFNISGGIYARLGLYNEALNYYRDAMPFAKSRDERLVYQTENNIALIYLKLERFSEALVTFENYKDYAKKNNQHLNESFASTNIALALIGLNKYDEALKILDQAIALQEQHNFTNHLATSLVLRGKVLRLSNRLADSEAVQIQALKLINEKDIDSEYMNAILCLATTYDAQNNVKKAIEILTSVGLKNNKYVDFTTQLDIAKFSSHLYEKQGNFESALSAFKQYNEIKTAVLTRQASVNIAKALAEADLAAKEIRIAELTKAEQIKATKAKAFKELTIAISICLVVILFGSFAAIHSIDNKNKKLANALKQLHDTQKHLIEIEKIASLTALVSGMAHQLNTPIGTIVTASSLIDEYLLSISEKFKAQQLTSKCFHQFITNTASAKELVISNINRLASIVEEFKALNVSIALDKPPVEISLPDYLKQQLSFLDNYLGKQISYSVTGSKVSIVSHPSIITDVLKTLVINSYEHGFKNQDNGSVNMHLVEHGDYVDIVYQDNGVGIKDEILSEIFTPFYTTNLGEQHLGLGLNVVFNAVQYNLKGEICAESCEHGARFIITLPLDIRLVTNNQEAFD